MYRISVKLSRVLINKRRSWIPWLLFCSLCVVIIIVKHRSNSDRTRIELFGKVFLSSSNSLKFDHIKELLDQLFDPSISLIELQSIWNKLINIWYEVLIKFLHNACELCDENYPDCSESIDLVRYVYHINESFYPFTESKRPIGMGIYYYFDLKTLHSFNNSILPTDVSYCDYFHMIQLMMNVQLILHQARIKYFLTKGTLIGTLRHHDIIPWDTDIDLFIPSTARKKLLSSFRQLDSSLLNASITARNGRPKSMKDRRSYQEDLVIQPFKNIYKIISYKIFSLRFPIVNRTNYGWPKVDVYIYEENSTHIYAYPKHYHNLCTMKYIAKNNTEPVYLRLLGPLLVPSTNNPRKSLKAMVRLGPSNVFDVCEGNTFLHRYNQKPIETWRIPCEELLQSYSFVKSQYNSTNNLCYEELKHSQRNHSLSYYIYKCDEYLRRTL